MPNLLVHETSPYLLQHANNPVNWVPWGPEAFVAARAEDKPIFLSIGYAACHWCHVMAHESFEDEQIAAILNRHFISIKVDREERPDVDSVYMNAVVTMTGQGGWPMSVFLTPEGEPFYGGTYFPPQPRYGMPSFRDVLLAAANAWRDDQGEIRQSAQKLTEHISAYANWAGTPGGSIRPELLEQATNSLLNAYDWQHGGWGQAPRFPQPMAIDFLLLQATRGNSRALQAATHALRQMSRGGMYDLVGGGFSRYSTDDRWLVPHFEKMLYDNAQLALAYLHAGLIEGSSALLATCTETLDFIQDELTHPEGGFYSSLDADSEGEEGKFYLWETLELRSILADPGEFEWFQQLVDLPSGGHYEGKIVLQLRADLTDLAHILGEDTAAISQRLAQIWQKLRQARSSRVRPATDDKILTSWNALALHAFAEAARYLDRQDYLTTAQRNADFLLSNLYRDGRLLRVWRQGKARQPAFLEDYAGLIIGLLSLYQSDHDPRWYHAADRLTEQMIDLFRDPAGGFYDTPADLNDLVIRPKDFQDNAVPCGNSLAAHALLTVAEYSGNHLYHSLVHPTLVTLQDNLVRHPTAFGRWLQAVDFMIGPVKQVAIAAPNQLDDAGPFLKHLWSKYRPRLVAAVASTPIPESSPPLLHDRPLLNGQATAYVCEGFTCKLPVTEVDELTAQLA